VGYIRGEKCGKGTRAEEYAKVAGTATNQA